MTHRYKILMLGESNVGKTSLIHRFKDSTFKNTILNTIGIDFITKPITINNTPLKLQIWDTAGQERYHSITKSYYRNAHGIVLVFDVTDGRSYECVDRWYEGVLEEVGERVPVYLVGNKKDVLGEEYDGREYEEKALRMGMRFFSTSAKSGENVEEVFYEMGKLLLERGGEEEEERVVLGDRKPKKKCCL